MLQQLTNSGVGLSGAMITQGRGFVVPLGLIKAPFKDSPAGCKLNAGGLDLMAVLIDDIARAGCDVIVDHDPPLSLSGRLGELRRSPERSWIEALRMQIQHVVVEITCIVLVDASRSKSSIIGLVS